MIKKTGLRTLLLGTVFLLSLIGGYLAPVQMMELKIRDWLFELRGPQEVSHSEIVIVEMSQQADEDIPYKYPWPTYLYGKLVENLNKAGVKAIGIDVIFDQRDLYDLKNDSIFANALAEYGNVILGAAFSRGEQVSRDGVSREVSRLVQPNSVLRDANPNTPGLTNIVTDADEFIRRYLLFQNVMGQNRYSFGIELLRLISNEEPYEVEQKDGFLEVGPFRIPLIQHNKMLINYYGGGDTFKYLSFEEIIDDRDFETVTEREAFETNLFDDPGYGVLHQGILKDKIVLVGATMPELQDFHPVPMKNRRGNSQMAGVEVQANALQTILDQNFLYLGANWISILCIFLFAVITVGATRYLPGWGGLVAMSGLIAGWVLCAYYIFVVHQLVLFYIGPTFAIMIGYGSTTAYQYFKEEREKQRIRKMFSSYVSPELVNRLLDSEQLFKLGGNEMELTAFFTDIVNFTTLSEKLPAIRLIQLINEYLEKMTAIVMEEEGTLDKYIGDAIMAFYGAPVKIERHAEKACRTAIRMQDVLAELREEWQTRNGDIPEGFFNLRIRIGINTGRMVVGNMGSSQRFNYTVLGDQVNVAARCESACKIYGVEIVVTENTYRQAKGGKQPMIFRYLDKIRIKGRSEPIRIFELIGYEKYQSPEVVAALKQYEEACRQFRERKWDEAKKKFEQVLPFEKQILGFEPDRVSPSLLYIRRCKLMKEQPPGKSWDGVFEQIQGSV